MLSAALLLSTALAASSPAPGTALEVGSLPPTAFALPSAGGDSFDLAAARGRHAVLLVFFRGTW